LYIAGAGRIGSTLVGNVLGNIPGLFFVSEVMNIWRHFLLNKDRCGCGQLVQDCPVWGPVLSTAFADGGEGIAAKMDNWRKRSTRNRYAPQLLLPFLRTRFAIRLQEYLDNLEKLYCTTQSVTGCRVIVDSSKRPTYAALLNLIPAVDLYIIHLVRDPRAVSFSWLRRKKQSEKEGQASYMRIMSPSKSATRWLKMNLLTELFWAHFSGRYMVLRYEDFIRSPQEAIRRILDLINERPESLPFTGERTVNLGTNHAVWGNPSRRETGMVELKLDNEWVSNMRPLHKFTVGFLTWPLLKKYGYNHEE
jgi:hypothetical protein